jgi:hypothetical protein
MKALAIALLVIVAACGRGKAIFNVDAQSFMAGTGKDTIPYAVPPFTTASASTFQKLTLPPGFGKSFVDSVKISTGALNLINAGGTGTIGLSMYFASDSAGTLTAPAAFNIPATNVNGAGTFPVAVSGDVSSVVNDLFTQETVWIRLQATGTNSGATPVSGKGLITALMIRVVVEDRIF